MDQSRPISETVAEKNHTFFGSSSQHLQGITPCSSAISAFTNKPESKAAKHISYIASKVPESGSCFHCWHCCCCLGNSSLRPSGFNMSYETNVVRLVLPLMLTGSKGPKMVCLHPFICSPRSSQAADASACVTGDVPVPVAARHHPTGHGSGPLVMWNT